MTSLFLSHGAPDRIIHESDAKKFLQAFPSTIKVPKAIIIFSAHWVSDRLTITKSGKLENSKDFYGFPRDLNTINYAVDQPQWLEDCVVECLDKSGYNVDIVQRGIDHGVWTLLALMYPKADVPVLQISLPRYANLTQYIELGSALKALAHQNILVIGSGSATHNLQRISHESAPPVWALEFVEWLHTAVLDNQYDQLVNIYSYAPHGRVAHPTLEHYVPLLVACGVCANGDAELIHDSYEYGSLNNSSFIFR